MQITIMFKDNEHDDLTLPIKDSLLQEGFLVCVMPDDSVCGWPCESIQYFEVASPGVGDE